MMLASAHPVRRGLLVALVSLCGFAAPAAADDPIATRFEMYGFAGAHVLSLRSRTDDGGNRYAVTIDFMTQGMAAVFVKMTSNAQVSGRIVGGMAQPDLFRSDSNRNGVERHSRIEYRPDGDIGATTAPPLQQSPPPGQVRGTVDNLTAYVRLQRQLALTGHCAMRARVFDGRHGYDLIFSDAGAETLSPMGGQNFTGKAIACRLEHRVWPDLPDPEKDEGARGGTIWYARLVPGNLLVPVRMRMDTQFGVVEGFLAELHGRGVNLTLME